LVSAFVMVSTVCSVNCLLFFYSRAVLSVPYRVGPTGPKSVSAGLAYGL